MKTVHQDPEEIFEVYDHSGKKTGRARRSEVHGNPALVHRVAHVLVFNSAGDLYLQKRSEVKDIQPGKWDSSVGGHLDLGEGYLQAAKRELKEELGVTERVELVRLYDYPWRNKIESEDVRTYAATFDGPINPDPAEISEGKFWKMAEVKEAVGSGIFTPNFEKELELYRQWFELSGKA